MPEISKLAEIHLLDLSPRVLANLITLRDYQLFQAIPATSYIENLKDEPTPELLKFENINNTELFWVVWSILQESKPERRAKVIKFFLQVAQSFRQLKNLNSFFNVVFGLGNPVISRLKKTWEFVGAKWQRNLKEFEKFLDPSRNMSMYRSLLRKFLESKNGLLRAKTGPIWNLFLKNPFLRRMQKRTTTNTFLSNSP